MSVQQIDEATRGSTAAPLPPPDAPLSVDLMAKYFRALADPTRLRILQLLTHGELSVGELVVGTGQSQPKVSNHLACLRWCGFVVARREHPWVYYSISDRRVVEVLELAGGLLGLSQEHVACCRVLAEEA